MSEIKSFSLLNSLSPVEKRKALNNLRSRNTNPEKSDPQVNFFEVTCKVLKKSEGMTAEAIKLSIWKKIYPGQEYQDTRFRKLAFRLNKYLQEFLMGEYLVKEKGFEGLKNILLYRMLWQRQQGKALESLGKKLAGEPTELFAVNRFMEYRSLLEGGMQDGEAMQKSLDALAEMEEHEHVFRQLKRICLEWVGVGGVPRERWEGVLSKGLELAGVGRVWAGLLQVLVTLEVEGLIGGRKSVYDFVGQFPEWEGKPMQEIYLIYLMMRRYLMGRLDDQENGGAIFLRPLLQWEKGFRSLNPDFDQKMDVPEYLYLFDRGVGYLSLDEVDELLGEYIGLVPDHLADKMALTIRCLYLFQEGAYEKVLEISDWYEVSLAYAPNEKDEQHLAIRLGMVQFQSKIALKLSMPSIELQKRWVSRCIRKCPTMKNGTKAMLRNMIDFSMMLNKKFPKCVMLDYLEKVKEMEVVKGLGIHKEWLRERFMARCSA